MLIIPHPAAHGGLLAAQIVTAVQKHFSTTLAKQNQPNTYDLNLVFLRPTTAGPTRIKVSETKLGPKFSTVHVELSQSGKARVTGYASNISMALERGLSLPTAFSLHPPLPATRTSDLARDTDPNWVGWTAPWHPDSLIKPFSHIRIYALRNGPVHPSITDLWLTPAKEDEVFTMDMLGYVADHWVRVGENYKPDSIFLGPNIEAREREAGMWDGAEKGGRERGMEGERGGGAEGGMFWVYPTVSLGLEIKKPLREEGEKWLFVRARAKSIRNGRFDARVTILDEGGELVALSHQVSFLINDGVGDGDGDSAGGSKAKI
ncbi:MAG: hypothetical protein MMC23_001983 [Stictis urceolatum]|nr:hypothetical protein [Stictis urceolata]